jgi:hypothetical protein
LRRFSKNTTMEFDITALDRDLMWNSTSVIWVSSAAILLAILLYEVIQHREILAGGTLHERRNRLVRFSLPFILVLVIAVCATVVYWRTPGFEPKDLPSPTPPSSPWGMVASMYLAMLLGIVAQSYYFSERISSVTVTSWLKPVLASPIIFVPLVSSYQSSLVSMTSVGVSELLIVLVSFQNGFFWKVVFDKQAELLGRLEAA